MKQYEIKKTVTDQQIDDMMDSALSGITYWADEAKVKGNYPEDKWTSEALTQGFSIMIHEIDEKWHILTIKKILAGLSMMDDVDIEGYDMLDADRVVQYALFGEVIYS